MLSIGMPFGSPTPIEMRKLSGSIKKAY